MQALGENSVLTDLMHRIHNGRFYSKKTSTSRCNDRMSGDSKISIIAVDQTNYYYLAPLMTLTSAKQIY